MLVQYKDRQHGDWNQNQNQNTNLYETGRLCSNYFFMLGSYSKVSLLRPLDV